MEHSVCAIYDKKTGNFGHMVTIHPAEAVREWPTLINNKETKFGKHPEDFELFEIAKFDSKTAQYKNITPPNHLASGV